MDLVEKLKKQCIPRSPERDMTIQKVEDGVKYSMRFKSFRIKDPRSGEEYEFPSGHMVIVRKREKIEDSDVECLSWPFIEEPYSHPFLSRFNEPGQKVFGLDLQNPWLKQLPLEQRIIGMLHMAVNILREGYNMRSIPYYHLNNKIFDKYKIPKECLL